MENQAPENVIKKLVADFRARKGVFQNRINVEDWVPTNIFWVWGVYN